MFGSSMLLYGPGVDMEVRLWAKTARYWVGKGKKFLQESHSKVPRTHTRQMVFQQMLHMVCGWWHDCVRMSQLMVAFQ